MDFLINTREGHCERFASALALMLRSQGIPSRVVVGFRGAPDPVDGDYIIRRNQAHAWVEMLSSPLPPAAWIMLDPTPAAESPAPIPYSLWEWWRDSQRTGQQLWGGLVVNYTAEEQADLWARLWLSLVKTGEMTAGWGLCALAAAGALTWSGLHWRRRTRAGGGPTTGPAVAGYARLLALLARHGGPRSCVGQTPREFADGARRFLLAGSVSRPFADLADEIVDRLYRVRFGGRSLTEEEKSFVSVRLDQLEAALRRPRSDPQFSALEAGEL